MQSSVTHLLNLSIYLGYLSASQLVSKYVCQSLSLSVYLAIYISPYLVICLPIHPKKLHYNNYITLHYNNVITLL